VTDRARQEIEAIAGGRGAVLFGVADLRAVDLDAISAAADQVSLAGLTTGISYGYRLSDVVVDGIADHPTRTYQYHYRQVNLLLDHIGLVIASHIQRMGRSVFPVPSSQILDRDTCKGHVSHKAVARLAGLGWIGRSNLLVTRDHGARVRLATVLTDLDLPCDRPLEGDYAECAGCGGCRTCVEACPGGAIGDTLRDFSLAKCLETIDRVRLAENVGSRICGICVRACRGPGG
jgi:epoxyqueuosine reductase